MALEQITPLIPWGAVFYHLETPSIWQWTWSSRKKYAYIHELRIEPHLIPFPRENRPWREAPLSLMTYSFSCISSCNKLILWYNSNFVLWLSLAEWDGCTTGFRPDEQYMALTCMSKSKMLQLFLSFVDQSVYLCEMQNSWMYWRRENETPAWKSLGRQLPIQGRFMHVAKIVFVPFSPFSLWLASCFLELSMHPSCIHLDWCLAKATKRWVYGDGGGT